MNIFHISKAWWQDLVGTFQVPNINEDCYKQAEKFRSKFKAGDSFDENASRFCLDHARRRLDVQMENERVLDAKADRLAKFSIAMSGGLVAVAKAFDFALSHLLSVSVVFFALASIVSIRAQRSFSRPLVPSIKDVVERSAPDPLREVYLAVSYHPVIVGMEVLNAWSAKAIRTAHRLISVAVIVLALVVIFGVSSNEPNQTSSDPVTPADHSEEDHSESASDR